MKWVQVRNDSWTGRRRRRRQLVGWLCVCIRAGPEHASGCPFHGDLHICIMALSDGWVSEVDTHTHKHTYNYTTSSIFECIECIYFPRVLFANDLASADRQTEFFCRDEHFEVFAPIRWSVVCCWDQLAQTKFHTQRVRFLGTRFKTPAVTRFLLTTGPWLLEGRTLVNKTKQNILYCFWNRKYWVMSRF